jgi:hypothetical protein
MAAYNILLQALKIKGINVDDLLKEVESEVVIEQN